MNAIQIRRIYAAPAPEDGYRILVDRLWPRGVSRAENRFDLWARDVAPSAELRKSFAHQAERFPAFARAYRAELDSSPAAADFVRACGEVLTSRPVTLLYAAKDERENNAAVLCAWVRQRLAEDR
jgi:uncharacterized protein YeaO (DUF488 family)